MILKNRFLWSDNGTIKDLTNTLDNHISGTEVLAFNASQDFIYLGSEAPFNHRWFEVSVVNSEASKVSEVALWTGNKWQPVVEIIDMTLNSAGTSSFTKSGLIAWVPDKDEPGWAREDTTIRSVERVTGLGSVKIYGLFWARIKLSANPTQTMALKYVGHKFSNDEDLFSLYNEFSTTEAKTRYQSGLTTWDQLHFEAAKEIIRDLKANQIANSGNQVLNWEIFRLPSVHKVAKLIFMGFGTDWQQEAAQAENAYKEAMKVDLFDIDLDQNALLTDREINFRAGRFYR